MPDSDQSELQRDIDRLRTILSVVDSNLALETVPSEGMGDLRAAIDSLRAKVWMMLRAGHRLQEQAFVSRVRVRRAIETCEEAFADLRTGAVTPETPGYSVFRATLLELSHALERTDGDD